jgi:myo-inositol 2-dehydrogenase/D-chiro-inositol 1-dehydrogenase
MTLGIGVVGTGMIGVDHIRRITDVLAGGRVVAVTDADRGRAAKAAEKPGASVYDDAASLIAASEVDAVLISSWGPAHEEAILPALKAGKPVFCEKPLATTQEACLRIIDAEVKAAGRRLIQVGFMRRYDAAYRALKQTLTSGRIGAPLMYHAAHRNASVPAELYTSEMAISDTMVHDIDVARWLLDDEVRTVQVFAGRKNAAGGDLRDPIFAVMEMTGGVLATVEISVNIGYGYDIRGEISGEKGTAELAESNPVVVKAGDGFSGRVPSDWRERFITAYDVEIAEWIAAASEGGATGPSAWDGYAITAVSDSALQAADSGEAVEVTLVGRPALYG